MRSSLFLRQLVPERLARRFFTPARSPGRVFTTQRLPKRFFTQERSRRRRVQKHDPMYFPYGQSNFMDIRHSKQFYVDNTRFIVKLEEDGRNLFFLRPPRWGKSLMETTLEAYYDLNVPKKKFEQVFSGLDVLDQKTSGAGQYFVLKWVSCVNLELNLL